MNQNIHDPLIQCIESDIGQSSEDLALALNRSYTKDGQLILQKLHAEGMLKKVQTELIVMTPTPTTKIKLNELNKILDEMKQGESAVKKLAEMDKQLGMQDPVQVAKRMRGDQENKTAPTGVQASGDALGDTAIANNLRKQAEAMDREARGLMAEAQRLLTEAAALSSSTTEATVAPTKKTKGRPKKASVTA
jgi:hypothetical protein